MEAADVAPSRSAPLAGLLAAAAAVSAALGVESAWSFRTSPGGLLGLVLPWAGTLFYAALAALAWRRASSPWMSHGVGFAVFVHASLLAESFLAGRFCAGCVAAGVLALSVGVGRFLRWRADRVVLGLSLGLGALSGAFEPFDRVDGALTRSLWPARVFSIAPAFVDRGELAGCEHGRGVRLILYEKDCKT